MKLKYVMQVQIRNEYYTNKYLYLKTMKEE